MPNMVARASTNPEQGLQAQDTATRLQHLRELKNQVIGNKFKKLEKLYLVPLLLELVGSHEPEVQVQAIATLGSLAYGIEDGVRAIVAASGIPAIMAALESNDQRVVVAAARSLKLLYQSPLAPHEPLLAGPTLQRLVGLLQDTSHQGAVATAAASVLAHCCSSAEEAAQMVAAGAVTALVPLLSSNTHCCQEAALEALAAISQHSQPACQQLLAIQPTPQQPEQQQASLPASDSTPAAGSSSSSKQPAAGAPSGPAEGLQAQQQQAAMQRCAVVSQLLQLSRQRDAQLRCLVAKCISNFHPAAAQVQQLPEDVNEELLHAARVMLPHLVRLLPAAAALACTAAETLEFITKHTHHPHYPPFSAGSSKGAAAKGQAALLEAGSAAGDQGCLTEVPSVMAQLVGEREEFIDLAMELDSVKQLMTILTKSSAVAAAAAATAQSHASSVAAAAAAAGHSNGAAAHATAAQAAAAAAKRARAAAAAAAAVDAAAGIIKLRRGSLHALAALAVGSETARQQMVDSRLVPVLVGALSEPDAEVRLGAADTLRGLSRSVRVLRGPTLTPDLAAPLVSLLQDSSCCEVQVAAAGAVCNVALDFSNLCAPLVEAGLTQVLCGLLSSMLPELRYKALWALKNLAFGCDAALQRQLLQQLNWGEFRGLLVGDDDARVRTQAAGLLQNLCKGGVDLEQVRQWSNNELLAVLEDQLNPDHYHTVFNAAAAAAFAAGAATAAAASASATTPPAPPAAVAALAAFAAEAAPAAVDEAQLEAVKSRLPGLLYTTSNFCSGTEQHKVAVMSSKVPQMLLQYFMHVSACAAAESCGTATAGGSTTQGSQGAGLSAEAAAEAADAGCSSQAGGGSETAAAAGSGDGGASAAIRALSSLTLPAVWCVINLLWYQDVTGTAAGAAAGAAAGGAAAGAADAAAAAGATQGTPGSAAPGAGGAGGDSGGTTAAEAQAAGTAAAVGADGGGASSSRSEGVTGGGDGDVSMAAADEPGLDVRAAVAARAAVLRGMGFETVLQELLRAHRAIAARQAASAAAAAAEVASHSSPAEADIAALTAAWSSVSAEDAQQDLIERLQTALQQLAIMPGTQA